MIVVGLHLRWGGVWQRPNHVLSRLKSLAEILVVEEELQSDDDAERLERNAGILVLTPLRRAPGRGVDARTIETVRRLVDGRSALLWLYSPMFLKLATALPGAPIVYDKMDELAAFAGADVDLAALERQVCARADYVFAGGLTLWESVRERVRAGGAFPSGVDVAHYAAAASGGRMPEFAAWPGPIFGYIGVLDERLDLDLVATVARARPDATLLMVGPVAKIDPATLPREPNIRYYGKAPYAALPALVAGFDVALMPFALNAATRSISPTKTLEYLAARRPVVSTAVIDVVREFSDIVYITQDAAEFVAALAIAERGDDVRAERGVARAASMTWDFIVERMSAALCDAHVMQRTQCIAGVGLP